MRRRLLLLTAATTALVLVALLVPLALLARSHAADQATTEATTRAQSLASGVGAALGSPSGRDTAASLVEGVNSPSQPVASVILGDGSVLGPEDDGIDDTVRLARTGRAFTYAPPTGGRTVLLPVQGTEGGTAVVRVSLSRKQLYDGMLASWLAFGGIGVGLLLVALLIADRLGTRLVGATRRLAGVAEQLATGDLTARARPEGPPELRLVAAELNHLAGRIGDLLVTERENAADLAHRLRTPLAALRLDAEGVRDPAEAERIAAGVAALERGVDDVIRKARRPLADVRAATDLSAVARERTAFWLPLAEDQDREVEVDAPAVALLVAPPEDELAAVLDALIGNVLDHTPHGVPFQVSVTRSTIDSNDGNKCTDSNNCNNRVDSTDGVRLTVTDHGPGIPAEYVAERGASGAGSTGLGLDIARRSALEAGGRFEAGRRPAGGTVVSLTFPQAPRAAEHPRETLPVPSAPSG
ncbi:sensor histidine kinase [Streptomyces sp. NPDC048527]|uniref:sensor histidine kinase n=1 Tax=Streptomyces sp. NPDC048527 TaxID=3365568 RepID=UPI00371B5E44